MYMGLKLGGKYMTGEFRQKYYDKTEEQKFSLEELQNKCRKQVVIYPYQDTETANLEGEKWKLYPYLEYILSQYNPNHYIGKEYHKIKNFLVSNRGRVKVEYKDMNEEILRQTDDIEGGYLRIPKYPGFGNVYRLVADTWLERPDKNKNIVHHIDNDGYNNRTENLIWVDNAEHGKIHGFETGN